MIGNPFLRSVWMAGALLLAVPGALAARTSVPAVATAQVPASVPRARRHEYRHEIEQMEEQWRTAMLKGNSAVLASLLADDYTAITATGVIQTRDQAVESLKSGALQLTSLVTSDRKVRIYGATAVVTSLAELIGTRNDQEMTGRYRYTRVYVRGQNGQWKIVSFEASRIQEPGEKR